MHHIFAYIYTYILYYLILYSSSKNDIQFQIIFSLDFYFLSRASNEIILSSCIIEISYKYDREFHKFKMISISYFSDQYNTRTQSTLYKSVLVILYLKIFNRTSVAWNIVVKISRSVIMLDSFINRYMTTQIAKEGCCIRPTISALAVMHICNYER